MIQALCSRLPSSFVSSCTPESVTLACAVCAVAFTALRYLKDPECKRGLNAIMTVTALSFAAGSVFTSCLCAQLPKRDSQCFSNLGVFIIPAATVFCALVGVGAAMSKTN